MQIKSTTHHNLEERLELHHEMEATRQSLYFDKQSYRYYWLSEESMSWHTDPNNPDQIDLELVFSTRNRQHFEIFAAHYVYMIEHFLVGPAMRYLRKRKQRTI